MTDFLNELIARSAGTWETVRPRPASVFEPVEPDTGLFGMTEDDVAALGDDDTANPWEEAADVAPAWSQVKAEDDTAAASRASDRPGIPATPAARESEPDLPGPEARAAQRLEAARPDEPRQRRRREPMPSPAVGRAGNLPEADIPPAPPKAERSPAARTTEAAPRTNRDGAFSAAQRIDRRSDDEDALADILRKLIVSQYVRATPGPDQESARAMPLATEPGEARPSGGVYPRPPRPPEAAAPEVETKSLRRGRRPEARGQTGEGTRRRDSTTQRGDGPASMRLSPLPEPILHFPADRHAETSVHITIGRVEVRAITEAQEVPAPRRPQPTLMSLDDYLKQRSAGDG